MLVNKEKEAIGVGVILETNQLCKFYGTGENQVKAVNHVNIQIEQGEFVAIVGKSGSGKSTLLHMLGGLDTPTSGSVILSDKDLYSMKEDQLAVFRRRKIGFVFQAFNLVSSINVWENIVLPLGLDGKKWIKLTSMILSPHWALNTGFIIFRIPSPEDSSSALRLQEPW